MKLTNVVLTLCSGLLTVGMCVPTPRQEPSNSGLVSQENQNKHQENKNVPDLPATQNVKSSDGADKQDGKQAPEVKQTHVIVDNIPRKYGWQEVSVITNIGLAVIAALTLGAIWYQAKQTARAANATSDAAKATQDSVAEIRRQAEATEKAAEATKSNVEVLVASERAWILPETESAKIEFTENRIQTYFILKNSGQTPCRVVNLCATFIAISTNQKLPENSVYPEGQNLETTLGRDGKLESSFSFMANNVAEIQHGGITIYVYGFVKYIIIGDRERESRFCFRCRDASQPTNKLSLDITAPSSYTRCT